jgi:MinD superfamily P-loop ATPase
VTTTNGTLYYYCVITQAGGLGCGVTNTAANDAIVTTSAQPTISTQPSASSETVCNSAAPASITVTATGGTGGAFTYQWWKVSSAVNTGGTNVGSGSSYTPVTSSSGTSYYYCVITQAGGTGCTVTNPAANDAIVTANYPAIALTGGSGAASQSSFTTTAITTISYTLSGGATSASIAWTGTSSSSAANGHHRQ